MTPHPDHWQDVKAIFTAIVDLDPEARRAALEVQCAGRAAIHDEVTSLLAAHDQAASFLSVGQDGLPADAGPDPVLGGWRLIERIGAGGMSDVYRAARADGDFTHQVAVKIVHASAFRSDMARRVRAERQILGGLHHPHIVALVDAGTAASGEAFLVMELVDGVPITHYAREGRLSLEQRLRLFGQVCSAVQVRASARRRAPRPETGQHSGHARRPRQGARFRRRDPARFRRRRHSVSPGPRHRPPPSRPTTPAPSSCEAFR